MDLRLRVLAALASSFLGACGDGAPDSVGAGDSGAETQSKNDSETFSEASSGDVSAEEPGASTDAWSESSTRPATNTGSGAGAGSSTGGSLTADILTVTGGPTATAAPSTSETPTGDTSEDSGAPLDTLQVDLSDALGQDPEGWSVGGGLGTLLERQMVDAVVYLAASVPVLEEGLRTFSWRLNDAQRQARETFTGFGFWVCGTGNVLTRASTERDDGDLDEFVTEAQPATLGWQFVQVVWSELGQLDSDRIYRVGFGATVESELRVFGFQLMRDAMPETADPEIVCPVQQKELDQ